MSKGGRAAGGAGVRTGAGQERDRKKTKCRARVRTRVRAGGPGITSGGQWRLGQAPPILPGECAASWAKQWRVRHILGSNVKIAPLCGAQKSRVCHSMGLNSGEFATFGATEWRVRHGLSSIGVCFVLLSTGRLCGLNIELDGEVDDGARSHPRERLVPAVENTPGDMWGKWGVAYGKIGSVMQWLVSVSYRFTRPALVSNVDGIQLGKKYKEAGRSSGATR